MQQVCGKGAEIAMATGTNVPASSNTSSSLAVRRYMTGTEPNLSPQRIRDEGPARKHLQVTVVLRG
jgi:hypothetical protein